MTEACSFSVAPISTGAEDCAQKHRHIRLLLQLLTPAALLAKDIKSAASLPAVLLDLGPLSS